MHRLLSLAVALLILFAAFQVGRLSPAQTSAGRPSEISLDLSPSASRQMIDRRYGAAAAAQSN